MNNGMWRYRHAAALGLVALLAGCGGGGGGGGSPTGLVPTPYPQPVVKPSPGCSLFYGLSGQVLNASGSGEGGVVVTATNPANGQACSTNVTNPDGTYVLATQSCANATSVTVSATLKTGQTVSNSWSSCQPVNDVNLTLDTSAALKAYQGTWSATYQSTSSSGDSGNCTVVVNAYGGISASTDNCQSNVSGNPSFALTGTLSPAGIFTGQAVYSGQSSPGAYYSGTFNPPSSTAPAATASGTWTNAATPPVSEGTWQATLQTNH